MGPFRRKLLIYCCYIVLFLNVGVPCSGSKIIETSAAKSLAEKSGATQFSLHIEDELNAEEIEPAHNIRKRLIVDGDDVFDDNDYEVYQGIVGRPGIDFPILKRIPKTTFDCRKHGSGYFADTETDCQVFHICEAGRKISFLCPTGTIFQQSDKICDWWYKVNCAASPSYYEDSAEFLERNPQHRVTYAQRLPHKFNSDDSTLFTNDYVPEKHTKNQYSTGEQQINGKQQQQQSEPQKRVLQSNKFLEQKSSPIVVERQRTPSTSRQQQQQTNKFFDQQKQQQQQKQKSTDQSDEYEQFNKSDGGGGGENYDFEDFGTKSTKTRITERPSVKSSTRIHQNQINNGDKNSNRNIKDISQSVGSVSSLEETLERAASGSFVNNRNNLNKQFDQDYRKNNALLLSKGTDESFARNKNSQQQFNDNIENFSGTNDDVSSSSAHKTQQTNNRISYFGPDDIEKVTDKPTFTLPTPQTTRHPVTATAFNKAARRGTATYQKTLSNQDTFGIKIQQQQRPQQQHQQQQQQQRQQHRQRQRNQQDRKRVSDQSAAYSYTTPNSIDQDFAVKSTFSNERKNVDFDRVTPFYTPTVPTIINRFENKLSYNNIQSPSTTASTSSSSSSSSTSSELSEHAFEMMKTLQKLNLDDSASKDFERLLKDQRAGIQIPSSAGPETLHSLALYFATAIDNDLAKEEEQIKSTLTTTASSVTITEHSPLDILALGQNITEISSAHLSNDTVKKYEKLFGLELPTTTESLSSQFQREQQQYIEKQQTSAGQRFGETNNKNIKVDIQGRFNQSPGIISSAEDLNTDHSTNPMSSDGLQTTQVRHLASVFTHALSAYLHDPAKFREALSEIRPTEPTPINTDTKSTTSEFITNRIGRTDDFHKGTGPTYLPTKSTPTYQRTTFTPSSSVTGDDLEVLDFSDVSISTTTSTTPKRTDSTSKQPQQQRTTFSNTTPSSHNTFDSATTIYPSKKVKIGQQNIKSADRVPASRLITETRFGSTQQTTTIYEDITTTTNNPLAMEINGGLTVSTSFPYFQEDDSSVESTKLSYFDDTNNYFPFDSSKERHILSNRNKLGYKPYGHDVKPSDSTPIHDEFGTTIISPTQWGDSKTIQKSSIKATIDTPASGSSLPFNLLPPSSNLKHKSFDDSSNDLQRAQSQSIVGGSKKGGSSDINILSFTDKPQQQQQQLQQQLQQQQQRQQQQQQQQVEQKRKLEQQQLQQQEEQERRQQQDQERKQQLQEERQQQQEKRKQKQEERKRQQEERQKQQQQQQQQLQQRFGSNEKYGPSTAYNFNEVETTTNVQSLFDSSSIRGHYITQTLPSVTTKSVDNSNSRGGANWGSQRENIRQTTLSPLIADSATDKSNTNQNWSTLGYTSYLDPHTINVGLMSSGNRNGGATDHKTFKFSNVSPTQNTFVTPTATQSYRISSNTKTPSFSFSSIPQTTYAPNTIEIGNRNTFSSKTGKFGSGGGSGNVDTYDRFGKSIASTIGTTTAPRSAASYRGNGNNDDDDEYLNAMQQKANHIFGSLNDTSADHLMSVMQKADDNRSVRRLILLLIQTCSDDDFNKTIEESRNALLNALIDMDVNENRDNSEIRIIKTKPNYRRGKSIGSNRFNSLDDDTDYDTTSVASSTSSMSTTTAEPPPITTYKRPYDFISNTLSPPYQFNSFADSVKTTTTVPPTASTLPSLEDFQLKNDDDAIENRFNNDSNESGEGDKTTSTTTADFDKFDTTTTTSFTSSSEITHSIFDAPAPTTTVAASPADFIYTTTIESEPQPPPPPTTTTTATATAKSLSPSRRVAKDLDDYLGQQPNQSNDNLHKTSDERALELLKSLYSLAGRFGKR